VRKRLADGSIRTDYYHRHTGTRLEGEPGSVEFIVSHAEAEKTLSPRHEGSCAALIRAFLTSPEFLNNLQPATQKEYRRMLTAIEAKFGDAPVKAMQDSRFGGDALDWRDEIAARKPREADNRMVVFGRLLSWAKKRHRISVNVLEGYERLYRSDRSDKIWLPEHIAAMQQAASPEFWPLFLGALHTGLRQGDLRKLPWSAYDGSAISWRITKRRRGSRGVPLRIPCTKALLSLLGSLPKRGPLIFTTKIGRAWQKRYVARQFELARSRAMETLPEIAELHFHDTRGTAITMLAEAGATVPEIAAITGHSYRTITSILEKYLPRTKHLAEMAIAKLENSGRTNFANRLQTGPSPQEQGESK
ncbi:MAG: tyrosine-type recombinase/integrase, partial [Alphaproteobacteria bacterium]